MGASSSTMNSYNLFLVVVTLLTSHSISWAFTAIHSSHLAYSFSVVDKTEALQSSLYSSIRSHHINELVPIPQHHSHRHYRSTPFSPHYRAPQSRTLLYSIEHCSDDGTAQSPSTRDAAYSDTPVSTIPPLRASTTPDLSMSGENAEPPTYNAATDAVLVSSVPSTPSIPSATSTTTVSAGTNPSTSTSPSLDPPPTPPSSAPLQSKSATNTNGNSYTSAAASNSNSDGNSNSDRRKNGFGQSGQQSASTKGVSNKDNATNELINNLLMRAVSLIQSSQNFKFRNPFNKGNKTTSDGSDELEMPRKPSSLKPLRLSFKSNHRQLISFNDTQTAVAYLSLPAANYSLLDSTLVSRSPSDPDTFILTLPLGELFNIGTLSSAAFYSPGGPSNARARSSTMYVATSLGTTVSVKPDPANNKVEMFSGNLYFEPTVNQRKQPKNQAGPYSSTRSYSSKSNYGSNANDNGDSYNDTNTNNDNDNGYHNNGNNREEDSNANTVDIGAQLNTDVPGLSSEIRFPKNPFPSASSSTSPLSTPKSSKENWSPFSRGRVKRTATAMVRGNLAISGDSSGSRSSDSSSTSDNTGSSSSSAYTSGNSSSEGEQGIGGSEDVIEPSLPTWLYWGGSAPDPNQHEGSPILSDTAQQRPNSIPTGSNSTVIKSSIQAGFKLTLSWDSVAPEAVSDEAEGPPSLGHNLEDLIILNETLNLLSDSALAALSEGTTPEDMIGKQVNSAPLDSAPTGGSSGGSGKGILSIDTESDTSGSTSSSGSTGKGIGSSAVSRADISGVGESTGEPYMSNNISDSDKDYSLSSNENNKSSRRMRISSSGNGRDISGAGRKALSASPPTPQPSWLIQHPKHKRFSKRRKALLLAGQTLHDLSAQLLGAIVRPVENTAMYQHYTMVYLPKLVIAWKFIMRIAKGLSSILKNQMLPVALVLVGIMSVVLTSLARAVYAQVERAIIVIREKIYNRPRGNGEDVRVLNLVADKDESGSGISMSSEHSGNERDGSALFSTASMSGPITPTTSNELMGKVKGAVQGVSSITGDVLVNKWQRLGGTILSVDELVRRKVIKSIVISEQQGIEMQFMPAIRFPFFWRRWSQSKSSPRGWRPLLLPSSVDSSMDKSSPQNPENITTGDLINTSAAVLIADAEIIPQSDAPTDVKESKSTRPFAQIKSWWKARSSSTSFEGEGTLDSQAHDGIPLSLYPVAVTAPGLETSAIGGRADMQTGESLTSLTSSPSSPPSPPSTSSPPSPPSSPSPSSPPSPPSSPSPSSPPSTLLARRVKDRQPGNDKDGPGVVKSLLLKVFGTKGNSPPEQTPDEVKTKNRRENSTIATVDTRTDIATNISDAQSVGVESNTNTSEDKVSPVRSLWNKVIGKKQDDKTADETTIDITSSGGGGNTVDGGSRLRGSFGASSQDAVVTAGDGSGPIDTHNEDGSKDRYKELGDSTASAKSGSSIDSCTADFGRGAQMKGASSSLNDSSVNQNFDQDYFESLNAVDDTENKTSSGSQTNSGSGRGSDTTSLYASSPALSPSSSSSVVYTDPHSELVVTATIDVWVDLNLPIREELSNAMAFPPVKLLLSQAGALTAKAALNSLAPTFSSLLIADYEKRKENELKRK